MRTGKSMRRIKNIDTARFQKAVNGGEMQRNIVGMKMFQKLVAECDIDTFVRQIQVIAVVNDQLEIRGTTSSNAR